MAEGLQIQIGANVASAVQGLNQVQTELDQTAKDAAALGNSVERASAKIRTLPAVTGQATTTLTNFSRVVQDAPFGIIGIANNIDPLVQSFNSLKASTGSTSGAFKALIGQLTGPAGLALGISVATSLLITYGDKLFGASQASKDLAEQTKKAADAQQSILQGLGSERAEIDKLILLINSENTTRRQKEEVLKKIQQINPQYFGDLKNEAGLVDKLTEAYKKYTASLVARSEVAVLTGELDDLSTEILKLEKSGATNEIIDLGLKKGLDGRLGVARLLTKEETAQLTLNTKYSAALRERQRILDEIAKRQVAPFVKPEKEKIDLGLLPGFSERSKELTKEANQFEIGIVTKAYEKRIQEGFKKLKPIKPELEIEANVQKVNEEFEKLKEPLILFNKYIDSFNSQISDAIGGLFESFAEGLGGENIGQKITAVFSTLLNAIGKALIQYGIVKEGLDKILGPAGVAIPGAAAIALGIAAIAASSLLKNFGGARADGGPVSGNTPYLVGERGPELFVPATSGRIVPNNQVGSFNGGLAAMLGGSGRGGTTLRGQDIILAYARTQRSQLRVNG